MSNGSLSSDAPAVRLCLILKWEDFDGYGFNLHAEKGKPGQYIGKVDEASPAEAAGLKQGDRIVEVNGVNISNENHKQVVQRIKAVPDETRLLVVDAEADSYYKSKSIIIKSTLPNVMHLKSPERSKANNEEDRDSVDTRSQKSERSSAFAENEQQPQQQMNGDKTSYKGSSGTTSPSSERKHSLASSPEPHNNQMPSPTEDGAIDSNNGSFYPSLNLNMTAAELRAQLAARKKYDPKKENIDLKRKFDIIQTL